MTIEAATYISSLNSANPGASDAISEGDDHIRLLKSTIKATFPNVAGAATPSHTELNYVTGVTSAIQTQINAKAPSVSPTFTTPALGTPASGVLTNCTGSASGLAAGAIVGGAAGSIPYQSAGSTTLFLAAGTSGQALVSGGAGAPTWFTLNYVGLTGSETIAGVKTFSSQPVLPQAFTTSTAVTLTNQTTVTFSSIPSWVKRIRLILKGATLASADQPVIRIGSGSLQTTGYNSNVAAINGGTGQGTLASGHALQATSAIASVMTGTVEFVNITGNVWVSTGINSNINNGALIFTTTDVSLSGTLDRIALTTVGGSVQFNAGTVNITYE